MQLTIKHIHVTFEEKANLQTAQDSPICTPPK